MTSDSERLELIQIFLVNVTQIENLDEALRETKATIKRQRDQLLADNERILERLRNRQTALPFEAAPTGDPDEPEEEEEPAPDPEGEGENGEETEDDDVEVDVLIDSEPAAQPEGGLQ
jgi:hypothetical protein